jgi:rod shape-determining protein MreB
MRQDTPARTMPARPVSRFRPAGSTALAVDLGSCVAGLWTAHHGTVTSACDDSSIPDRTLVRRGRVVDVDGCVRLLSRLVHRYPDRLPPGAVVVACQPVLATETDLNATHRVLDAVFAPSRVLFIDTVRAAAIGAGAAAGSLLVIDAGAGLTEVALLRNGQVIAARRADIGTRDLSRGATANQIADTVVSHVDELRAGPDAARLSTALTRGALLVGDGARHPQLAGAISTTLRVGVHRAFAPHTAALTGAGRAATSFLRHPVRMEPS